MVRMEALWRRSEDENHRKNLRRRLPKKTAKTLFAALKTKETEKDVENAWRKVFTEYYVERQNEGYQISSPENVDGFISVESGSLIFALRILLEFKRATDLTKTYDRARITCQCIHYMYKFKQNGIDLPNVIVGADEDQAFVLLASNFYKYLDEDKYNWKVAPSDAYKEDPVLMADLQDDANLAVYPFQFVGGNENERYNSLLDLFDSIDSILNSGDQHSYKVTVSPATIVGMFDQFREIAFREPNKIKPVKAVNMFMQMLTGKNDTDYYFLPRNRNLYHLPGDEKVKVYGVKLTTFLDHYDRNFTPKEIDKLTAIADRLIEANERRYKGDFWTPSIWAHRADEMMQETIGQDYKNTALVWDCAAGVRNLTRDYSYKNLYLSTYHQDEIYLGDGYNPEAKAAFQYDFLNDDVNLTPVDNPNPDEWKMPNSLFKALQEAGKNDQPIVFFTNPPYGTANNVQADGSSKRGIAKTLVNEQMRQKGLGKASQQLYCQFMFRTLQLIQQFKLNRAYVAFFTNARFFAGADYYQKFDDYFFRNFKFVDGNLLNAGEFSDTSDLWPITFSIYRYQPNDKPQHEYPLSVEQSYLTVNGTQQIKTITTHTMQMVDEKNTLSKWVREPLAIQKYSVANYSYPQLSSALKVAIGKNPYGRLYEGSLGYMVSNSDNIGEGFRGVWLVTSSAYKGHGFNVIPENFDRACVNFAARRAIDPIWYHNQDNYYRPDVTNPLFSEFVNDALIFTLFENSSFQVAYRNPEWSNTGVTGKWANQWFWLPIDYVREEVEDNPKLRLIYNDLRGDGDRFVAKKIMERNFSSEAQAVLNSANKVWRQTLKSRSAMFDDYPEFYLNAWDAGWYQIKRINELFPASGYDEFKRKFEILKNKIANNVYELGMLIRDTK